MAGLLPGMTLAQAMAVFIDGIIAPNRDGLRKIWRNGDIAVGVYQSPTTALGANSRETLQLMKWNSKDVVFRMPKKAVAAFSLTEHPSVDVAFRRWLRRNDSPVGRIWMFASHGNFLVNVDQRTMVCSVEPGSTDVERGEDPLISMPTGPVTLQPFAPPPHTYVGSEHGRFGFALGRKRSS